MKIAEIAKFLAVLIPILIIGIGVQGLLLRQVQVYAGRRTFWLVPLSYLAFFSRLNEPIYEQDLHTIAWDRLFLYGLMALMLGFPMFIAWQRAAGYNIFGITETSFYNALYATLQRLDLSYEVSQDKILLNANRQELKATVLGQLGLAQINLPNDPALLKKIVQGLREQLLQQGTPVNQWVYIFYGIIGAFLLAISLSAVRA
ncbi:MAG: hypothetical protein JST84_09395 [Acidobacteria bacterium]|nr:hypothetical protein [Acidobacteriota bacterium]